MRILNATPHPIYFYKEHQVCYDEKQRKYFLEDPNTEPAFVIEPSGVLLNVKVKYSLKEVKDGIPIYVQEVEHLDPVPEDYDIVIVSNLYASYAIKFGIAGVERLYTISQPVYADENNPRPIGCLGLDKVKP